MVVHDVPEAAVRLQANAVVLVPLISRETRLGLLTIGVHSDLGADAREELATIGHLLTMALERARTERDAAQSKDLRELGAFLTRSVASALDLNASLEIYCDRARRLFWADRVSVWLHDRRARSLDLVASSDIAEIAAHRRVPTDDAR